MHLHVVVFGEYIPQDELQRIWSEALGEKLAIAHIQAVRDDDPQRVQGALREVLKYATKGHGRMQQQAQRAAAVEFAFRNIHRVSVGGALLKIRPGDLAFEDVGPEELATLRFAGTAEGDEIEAAECSACGALGPWRFIGFVCEYAVINNGGFGLVQPQPGPAPPPPLAGQSALRTRPPVQSAVEGFWQDLPKMPSQAFAELRERANRWLRQQGFEVDDAPTSLPTECLDDD